MKFNQRIYGFAVVKSINSNYNADFSGQPRTLPDGNVYATDKAFKYTLKNLIKCLHPEKKVFYFKTLNEKMNPISLDETYQKFFGEFPGKKENIKKIVAKNLLSCIDIRCFGATFAGKTNISIHGPVQINPGVNIWQENNIYTEQITAPFSNKSGDADAEKGMTTIGRQSKLQEGHYLHHFSVNPANLHEIHKLAGEDAQSLNQQDIDLLKIAMRQGATFYDSAAKVGTDNEILFWLTLKENSKLILPNFMPLMKVLPEKENDCVVYDFEKVSKLLRKFEGEIDQVELYANWESVQFVNLPEDIKTYELFGSEIMEAAL